DRCITPKYRANISFGFVFYSKKCNLRLTYKIKKSIRNYRSLKSNTIKKHFYVLESKGSNALLISKIRKL
ncbi:MAG: hypothetical protein MSS98_03145, partial [Alphaproteobacteria bacterium]|nr:hypothetical protein [Alphaproteobacteria bacterium]